MSDGFITYNKWRKISEKDRQRIAAKIADDNRPTEGGGTVDLTASNSRYAKYGKRALDIIIGGTAFTLCIPINAAIGVITLVDVGKPVFYKQERIGMRGKTFNLIKFRNMTNETNEHGVLLQPEERITQWGRFARQASLDELMNFWSVLKGDMSIIGPRPLPLKYENRLSERHKKRHAVKPGLECPFHDSALAKDGWQGRLDNDVWYVENISFVTDMKQLLSLVKMTFSLKERSISATGRTGEFIGYSEDGRAINERRIPIEYLKVIEQ